MNVSLVSSEMCKTFDQHNKNHKADLQICAIIIDTERESDSCLVS